MIRIIRDRTAIPAGFRPPGNAKKELTLLSARQDHLKRLQTNPKAGHDYDSSWWKNAKPQLIIESAGKCAYCEAKTTAVTYGDVEHFRPKAEWWWLTCCWDNYLFSCQICNQLFKSENFPKSGKVSPAPFTVTVNTTPAQLQAMAGKLGPDPLLAAAADAHFKALAKVEKPDIIDPANEDPEALIAYEADDDAGTVKVIPRASTPAIKRRVKACLDCYGLNRDELCELRYETYEALADARDTLAEPGISAPRRAKLLKRLERFVKRQRQFAGMSRYYLIDLWKILPATLRN